MNQHFARVIDGIVAEVWAQPSPDVTPQLAFHPDFPGIWHICSADVTSGWRLNGETFVPPVVESIPLTIDDFRHAIQTHIDATAQNRSYDSGVTCSSYAGSTNVAWAAEAAAFIAWRDSVWGHAYVELAKVQGGQRPEPTIAALIDELPAIAWPS